MKQSEWNKLDDSQRIAYCGEYIEKHRCLSATAARWLLSRVEECLLRVRVLDDERGP